MPARTRFTLEGALGGGADIWTCSFHAEGTGGYTLTQLQDLADLVDVVFQGTWWTLTGSGCLDRYPPATSYVRTTVRDIDSSGITSRVTTAGPTNPILGAATDVSLPTEVTPCLSLLTETAGARGRGRMYLPPMSRDQLEALGTMTSSCQSALLDAAEAFIENLNAQAQFPGDVSVYSGVEDVLREVATIRMGNVWDSQRRRRNTIPETYSNRAITH